MPLPLSDDQLAALRELDTPTICNAIERFNVRGRVEGFLGIDIRCLLPELGSMVGYTVTATVDSTTPGAKQNEATWRAWVEAMAAASKPIVLVFQDVGPQPRKSAHFGEMMATLSKRLGVVGLVTNGGVRDILEVKRLGLHYFAAGLAPSHGSPRLLEINIPVTLDGVRIEPGDLLHGDINGVTTIPLAIAAQVIEAAQQVRRDEAEWLTYLTGPEFSLEGYFKRRFSH